MKILSIRLPLGLILSAILSTPMLSTHALASGSHDHHYQRKTNIQNRSELHVYKSATCGCCQKWIDKLKDDGLPTTQENSENMSALKDKLGIKKQYRSCHTAVSKDGYVFEGHIPTQYITQFLKEKPINTLGLSVPGMPVGSPGMEYQNKFMPYQVLVLNKDGTHSIYAEIDNAVQQ